MILDTSFLIDVMRSEAAALAQAQQLEVEQVPQRVPGIVVFELFVGVGHTDRCEEERDRIESVLDARPVLDLDRQTLRKAGRIKGELMASGDDLGTGDALVGATGVVRDEPVLTRNESDFEPIPDLEVRTY